jgi:hypothetical protein
LLVDHWSLSFLKLLVDLSTDHFIPREDLLIERRELSPIYLHQLQYMMQVVFLIDGSYTLFKCDTAKLSHLLLSSQSILNAFVAYIDDHSFNYSLVNDLTEELCSHYEFFLGISMEKL